MDYYANVAIGPRGSSAPETLTAVPGDRLTRPVSASDHLLGPASAPATLLMYGDYCCPYTRRSWPVVLELIEELEGRMRFAYRHFPHAPLRPLAQKTSEAAEAGAAQGRFWETHEALFRASTVIEDAHLVRYAAASVGLEREKFEEEMAGRLHAGRVLEDLQSGLKSGVRQTPAFFVNGVRHDETYVVRMLLLATFEDPTVWSGYGA